MSNLHVIQGGVSNRDKAFLDKASRGDATLWTVPKGAVPDDEVVIYIAGYGFYATAVVNSRTKLRKDRPNRYGAQITNFARIQPAISLGIICRHIPFLTWANYPRSITTPGAEVSEQIRKLINDRRKRGLSDLDDEALLEANMDELRAAALLAEKPSAPASVRETIFRVRSTAIKRYVLLRAGGICEGCDVHAPFDKADGSPYLEPHHTHQLSDEGPDHPAHVIALCPNCHRRAHFADDASKFNKSLIKALLKIEPDRTKKRSVK